MFPNRYQASIKNNLLCSTIISEDIDNTRCLFHSKVLPHSSLTQNFHLLIYSFNIFLLNDYCVPGWLLRASERMENKVDKSYSKSDGRGK